MSAGFYNGNVGPWLYAERGGFALHFYARWFRDPWDRGFRSGLSLRWRGRYRLFWTWDRTRMAPTAPMRLPVPTPSEQEAHRG